MNPTDYRFWIVTKSEDEGDNEWRVRKVIVDAHGEAHLDPGGGWACATFSEAQNTLRKNGLIGTDEPMPFAFLGLKFYEAWHETRYRKAPWLCMPVEKELEELQQRVYDLETEIDELEKSTDILTEKLQEKIDQDGATIGDLTSDIRQLKLWNEELQGILDAIIDENTPLLDRFRNALERL